MKRRLLSLALTLVMVLGMFAGLGVNASANDEIGRLFDRFLTSEKFSELLDENNVVYSGDCGKGGMANVRFKIYTVDADRVHELTSDTSIGEQNEIFKKLREKYPDINLDGKDLLTDLDFGLSDDQTYYAVKIYGNGEMEDYSLTKRAPWDGRVTINNEDVDLENLVIAAYISGPDNTYKTGVTNVGDRAFFGMDGLMLTYLGESVTSIGEKSFETCDKLCAINFPSALESIGRRAFYACDYLVFARMNSCTRLTEISERAFCTCSRLTSVWFPNSITKIGNFAFAWDHVLGTEEFALPANIKTVGTGAFAFCTHLGVVNELRIPASMTVIGDWSFAGCFDIRTIEIYPGNNPLSINTGAFVGNRNMESVVFPNRVNRIDKYAFAACDKLERVVFGDKYGTDSLYNAFIGDRAFDSLEDTGLAALRTIAESFKIAESGDAQYVDGSREAAEVLSGKVDELTGVTPLKYAAFGNIPPEKDNVSDAESTMHSFPRTVMIYFPSMEYNPSAYGKWRSVITPGNPSPTWCGYMCEPTWVGHYHEYGEPVIVPRTCTQDGKEVYTCHVWDENQECGQIMEIITDKATGHDSELIEMISATCTEPGIAYYHCNNKWCDKPDYSEVLPATGHDLDHLVNGSYQPPTCTEPGYAKGKCPNCGTELDEVLPAKGHNTTYMDLIKAPSCTEDGIYQGNCLDCEFGRTHVVQQSVPKLGHNWNDGVVIRPATITSDGSMLFTCMRCGESETRVIEKLIHTHQYEAVETVEATCAAGGYTHYICRTCGDEYYDQVSALGHKWDGGREQISPTATTDGRMIYTCTVCGVYRYETIPATGEITPTDKFVDVHAGDYFAIPVTWAVENNITTGMDDDHFAPNASCTRAQAVTFLYRAAGEPPVSGTCEFEDVFSDSYYYKAVLWAVKNGITTGTSATTFSPNDPCTRAHIVTFLHRAKNNPSVKTNVIPFSDVAAGQWYTLPVLWAVEKEVTNGMGDGTFGTSNNCTRGQIVTFLYRAKDL